MEQHNEEHNFNKQLVLVEYPGVVVNEQKAIRTLGGIQNISTTYSLRNRRLELRFRPDDAFSKPACGDRHKTLSLLLKVKIRRKKNRSEQVSEYGSSEESDGSTVSCYTDNPENVQCSITILGRIETAYRFKSNNTSIEKNLEMTVLLHPTSLEEPEEDALIFEDRPVWSKNALMFLTGYTSEQLKYLLPSVAYYFVTGPWRIMWVRFGYDPRADPSSIKYQTLDYRLRTIGGLKTKVKAKRSYCNYLLPYKSSPSCRPKTAVITKENLQLEKPDDKQTKAESMNENIYIFNPGTVPPSRQMFYQYCDVYVPEIQEMLEKLPAPPPSVKCHERMGWIPSASEIDKSNKEQQRETDEEDDYEEFEEEIGDEEIEGDVESDD
ncbi:hypothetical protein C0J52_05772 [Blattella germanica]|nr:hypothetical protein C0J52_05772 [Blattella germanica]